MATLLELRQRNSARICHLLVIEGCPYAFTNAPSLAGTSYINDGREILPGLDLPSTISLGINPREGLLREFATTFTVTETPDGKVASLFRGLFDDANADQVYQRIKSSESTVTTVVGADVSSVTASDRHLGIEKFGPSGERRHWYIHPGTPAAPFEHIWAGNDQTNGDYPRLIISDEPRVWSGRWVALHELVWDPDAQSWGTWSNQYDSGSLIWRGTMQGRGEIVNTAQWQLVCDGPASLTRRLLNRARVPVARAVTPRIVTTPAERGIAVMFKASKPLDVYSAQFNSSVFDDGNDLSAETNDELRTELNAIIDAAADGTDVNFTGFSIVFKDQLGGAGQVHSDKVTIKVNGSSASTYIGEMTLIMHSKFWAALGFDPAAQSYLDPGAENYVNFSPYDPLVNTPGYGYVASGVRDLTATALDYSGYWVGHFRTMSYDPGSSDTDNPGFSGAPYPWYPLFPGGVVAIQPSGNQLVSLATSDPVFVPSQNCFPPGGTYGDAEDRPKVGSNYVNAMGWWLLRGEIARGENQFAEVEFEEFVQVARCCWYAASDGTMGTVDGYASLYIEHLEDPRAFGFDHRTITEPWLSGGTTVLEAIPMAVFAHQDPTTAHTVPDRAYRLIPRTLLSSGTASAWGTSGQPTFPTLGDNQATLGNTADRISSDVEIADLGLGLEGEAVDLISFRTLAENTLTALDDPLGGVKYAYARPVQSEELLGSLLQGRGWCFGYLRRPGYKQPKWAGVDLYSPFTPDDINVLSGGAVLHITDSDLAGSARDNTTWIPRVQQTWRAPIDAFDVKTRGSMYDTSLGYSTRALALDQGSAHRHGATALGINDEGLSNLDLFGASGNDTKFNWRPGFLARFQRTIAEWMGKPHRTITLPVSAPKGQWLYPGQAFLLTNAAVNSLDGQSIGVTKVQCVVIENHKHLTGNIAGSHTVTAIMLGIPTGDGFAKVWAGSAQVTSVTDTGGGGYTLVCSEDWTGSGHGDKDCNAFAEPAWSSSGGSAVVKIYQSFDLETFPAGNVVKGTVSSVTPGTNTVTITGASGTLYADTLKVMILADYASQTAGSWVRDHVMFHTDGTGSTHSTGTAGSKLI